ncbi:MAG: hypothetical protein M3Q03_10750 [Chloroflexota bacterium]|nr:hypothetical protein [Chloroflexota bacterium]
MTRYCPAGEGAFEDWAERCPACGQPLQAEPPPAPSRMVAQPADEPVVFLATAPNEPVAQLWLQVLEDEGIRAMAKPAGPGYGAWGSVATFEHELFVLRSTHDRASAVIADLQADDEGTSG